MYMLLIVFFHGSYIRTSFNGYYIKKVWLLLFHFFLNAKKNLSMFEENVGGFQVKKNPCI